MAVYKIFPIKDSYISFENPNNNYGRDEIYEISSNPKSRALIQFDQDEINSLITDHTSGIYDANLKLYLSNASALPIDYTLEFNYINESWDMGTGRNGDQPNPQNGVSWNYATPTSSWDGGNYNNSGISQSFNYQSNKDINQDVKSIVNLWYNNIIPNNGILIKYNDIIESSSLEFNTKYFTSDTHTIYSPHLEFHWDDINYSSSLSVINNSNFISNITNLKKEFTSDNIFTFNIKNRDIYPTRQFQSSSIYLNNKILPSSSYWSLKDVKTEEIIIDYNDLGTKIGADDNGNYFTLYMNGLQPERYYQIIIKTIINDNVIIIDNPNNYFKIIR